MAREYRRQAAARGRGRKQSSPWLWFVAGLLVGLSTTGLLFLKTGGLARTEDAGTRLAGAADPGETGFASGEPPPKPRFDFYSVLPEMEVVIPEEEIPPSPSPQAPAPAKSPDTGTAYMLQMGSFRKYPEADRLKAQLALLGVEAEIQKVSINNRDTWHRVRSGPYRDIARVRELRSRLSQNQISSILIRLKTSG
jgi:hypothetical protein